MNIMYGENLANGRAGSDRDAGGMVIITNLTLFAFNAAIGSFQVNNNVDAWHLMRYNVIILLINLMKGGTYNA